MKNTFVEPDSKFNTAEKITNEIKETPQTEFQQEKNTNNNNNKSRTVLQETSDDRTWVTGFLIAESRKNITGHFKSMPKKIPKVNYSFQPYI